MDGLLVTSPTSAQADPSLEPISSCLLPFSMSNAILAFKEVSCWLNHTTDLAPHTAEPETSPGLGGDMLTSLISTGDHFNEPEHSPVCWGAAAQEKGTDA